MTKPATIAQADLRCTSCAGQCRFDPNSGDLTCESCGNAHEIYVDPNIDPAAEQHYHPDLPHTEQPVFSQDLPFECETCGGEVVFFGHSIAETCPYCAGALVQQAQGQSYDTLGMIPFCVGDDLAQAATQTWIAKRWAAPSDLGDVVAKGRVAGIYVPFWTFDSHEAVDYTVVYKVNRGKKTKIKTMAGSMTTTFDDLLMPGSHHVTPLIRDGILHDFDPENLRPFDPAYIAGFAAERHHQSVRDGLEHNAKDKALLLRNRIKHHSGKLRVVKVSYKTDTTGIKYRRILLPVWILHYDYKGKPMKVVTCGLQGRTFGERPFSTIKLMGLAAVAASAVAAFGFAWGALGIY